MVVVRSLLYHAAFYLATFVMLLATLPFFVLLRQDRIMAIAAAWSRMTLWLLRVVAGTGVEIRGRENLIGGASIIASKHQSMFETIALIPLLTNPTIVMKQSLRKIPLFGQCTVKTGMIHVDRGGKASALRALAERAHQELAKNREIIIFPEGTRRAPGAEPAYQSGIALVYRKLGAPVVPVAVNSGLYWPKRGFFRYPGTIIVEFLPAIEPGLDSHVFLHTLQERIETAALALLVEASRATPPPPLPPEAADRLAATS